MNAVTIGDLAIGPGYPCRVVAEIGSAHNSRFDLALRLIHESARAGADFIKLQCYSLDEITYLRRAAFKTEVPEPWRSMGFTDLRALYARALTPHDWFPELVAAAAFAGIPWFSSVFGLDSLALLEELHCPAYKLSAWDESEGWLRREVASTDKPLVVSTRDPRPTVRLGDVVLYCPEGYPQDFSSSGFPSAGECDGFSYHGTDWKVPAIIAAAGATMIEVHVQLDDQPAELDGHSSITVSDLARLCEAVAEIPTA